MPPFPVASIDTAHPNFARIYDYVLGGYHNFEADRTAAAAILRVFPPYPQWARMTRWFLQVAALRWAEAGIHHVLDLASGLPTAGHFHDTLPSAKVFYSDIDPVIVTFARTLLVGLPHATVEVGDVSNLPPLLTLATAFLGLPARVAIGCVGISELIEDTTLGQLARDLAHWAPPGSSLALTWSGIRPDSPKKAAIATAFQRYAAMPCVFRDPAQIVQLMQPWQVDEIKPLEVWLEVADSIEQEDRVSADFQMHGAFFRC